MSREYIQPTDLHTAPTYTPTVKAGNTIYVAGQTAVDEAGNVVGKGDITAQATQVMENLGKALRAGGADYSNLVKITAYITDPRFREPVAAVRAKYLKDPKPASTLVVCAGLASPDYLVEIEGIAVID
jgi:enamine deaminase RidA (YjgF/YER057c/UK114 family)